MRVLVVDDFKPIRRLISSILRSRTEFVSIFEASDGLEAIQKAQELQPDLILLDIGIPNVNGIEAARRIRQISPKSKILFVSQESSSDVVQEAFRSGGTGYVVKARVGSELLAAVDAVLRGERFVGNKVHGFDFPESFDVAPDETLRVKVALNRVELPCRHEMGFYSEDGRLLHGLSEFIHRKLIAGSAVIVLATAPHHEALLSRLRIQVLDVDEALKRGRYILLDAAQAFSAYMRDGVLDPIKFRQEATRLIERAQEAAIVGRRVAACGESAPLLCAQGNFDAALQFERLWDEMARKHSIDLLCGYSIASFQGDQGRRNLQQIYDQHSRVYYW